MDVLLFLLVAAAIGYGLYRLISRDNARTIESIDTDAPGSEPLRGPDELDR